MKDYEFRVTLSELSPLQQALTWWMVFRRWLFRPQRAPRPARVWTVFDESWEGPSRVWSFE